MDALRVLAILPVRVLRKITIEIKDQDYLDFQSAAENSGLGVDEKILEIIQYYIIIERNYDKL